jgi:hypothetical protein
MSVRNTQWRHAAVIDGSRSRIPLAPATRRVNGPPCLAEMPDLSRLQEQYGEQAGRPEWLAAGRNPGSRRDTGWV